MGIGYIGSMVAGGGGGVMSLKNSSSFMGKVDGIVSSKIGFSVLDVVNKDEPEIKIKDVKLQSSTYGRVIPDVYGRFILSGNIIYSSSIVLIKKTSSVRTKVGSQRYSEKEAIVTFAIAICYGIVDKINGIYADGSLIDINNSDIIIYYGTEDQEVSSVLSERIGYGKTPAFRGICYVVFNNFNITNYGNRIPNFTFDIEKGLTNENSAHKLVKSINIIPGAGEFVYETNIQEKFYLGYFNGKIVERSKRETLNSNNIDKKADALVALDNLFVDLPNIEWCSVICSWFANSNNASTTDIYPACEFNDYKIEPDPWTVGGFDRSNASMVTKDSNGNPNYGGTPSDHSVIMFFQELKNRGLKTVMYPMIFIDDYEKTWRGKFTYNDIESLRDNFLPKYKNYVLHYASLVKDFADAIIIGSEFVSLTKIKDENNNFIFVDFLIELANEVRLIVGSNTIITYAANWDEYHHTSGGWFNMDKLWASKNIDVIGIDAYFPLTNSTASVYDVNKIKDSWTSGEGYDFYYSGYKTDEKELSPAYAWKNIEYFWENYHYNPDGQRTLWMPKMKKIWFTEYGFPSVSSCTNEPNVFFKHDLHEKNFPYLSDGKIDFRAQRVAIEATELKWKDSEMIERMFLWCYDARPYPFFPQLENVWSDAGAWQYGHWVQGKIKSTSLIELIKTLCNKAGIDESDIEIINIQENLNGYCIHDSTKIIDILIDLSMVFDFEIYQFNDKIVFKSYKNPTVHNVDNQDMIIDENNDHLIIEKNNNFENPNAGQIFFNNYEDLYRIDNKDVSFFGLGNEKMAPKVIKTGVSMNSNDADIVIRSLMLNKFKNHDIYSLSLPYDKYSDISILDILYLKFQDQSIKTIRVTYLYVTYDKILKIQAYEDERFEERSFVSQSNYKPLLDTNNIIRLTELNYYLFESVNVDSVALDKLNIYLALDYKNIEYSDFTDVYFSYDDEKTYQLAASIENESDVGQLLSEIPSNINLLFPDYSNTIDIFFQDSSLNKLQKFDKKDLKNVQVNRIIINEYLIHFTDFELIESEELVFVRIKNLFLEKLNINYQSNDSLDKVFLMNDFMNYISIDKSFLNSNVYIKVVPSGEDIDFIEPMKFFIKGNSIIANENIQGRVEKDNEKMNFNFRPRAGVFNGSFSNLSKEHYYYCSIDSNKYYIGNDAKLSINSKQSLKDINLKIESVLRI